MERVYLDILVRYSALLESYPAFLRERAELAGDDNQMREIKADGGTYPTTIQDEFAVCLVIFDGLCGQTRGRRVKLEDAGSHGSMGDGGGGSERIKSDFGRWIRCLLSDLRPVRSSGSSTAE